MDGKSTFAIGSKWIMVLEWMARILHGHCHCELSSRCNISLPGTHSSTIIYNSMEEHRLQWLLSLVMSWLVSGTHRFWFPRGAVGEMGFYAGGRAEQSRISASDSTASLLEPPQ